MTTYSTHFNSTSSKKGIDYNDNLSPMVKPTTVRLVNNAFLHGVLSEKVLMSQLPVFIAESQPQPCMLVHRVIYGLKQAP